jgi:hypothetical protein
MLSAGRPSAAATSAREETSAGMMDRQQSRQGELQRGYSVEVSYTATRLQPQSVASKQGTAAGQIFDE